MPSATNSGSPRPSAPHQGYFDRAAQLLGPSLAGLHLRSSPTAPPRGIGELERALALNRNLGAAHAWIGPGENRYGSRGRDGGAHQRGVPHRARPKASASCGGTIGRLANFHLGKDEEAAGGVPPLDRHQSELSAKSFLWRRGARRSLGRLDEARAETKSALTIAPKYLAHPLPSNFAESDNAAFLAQRERICRRACARRECRKNDRFNSR